MLSTPLVAGKNCWHRHEWSVIWSAFIFRSRFCWLGRSSHRATWTPRSCTLNNGIKGCISRVELGRWNWQKTKVQALGSREDETSTITVPGQELAAVEEFVYNGSLVPSTRVTMQSLMPLCKTYTITSVSQEPPSPPSWSCRILAFYPLSCTALSVGQLLRDSNVRRIDAPMSMKAVGNQMFECWCEMDSQAITPFGYEEMLRWVVKRGRQGTRQLNTTIITTMTFAQYRTILLVKIIVLWLCQYYTESRPRPSTQQCIKTVHKQQLITR